MKLILVRHGEAHPNPADDFARTLTELGHEQAKATANHIFDRYTPDVSIVSPLKRAQQTLAEFINIFEEKNIHLPTYVSESIKPNSNAEDGVDALTKIQQETEASCLLVVCHMNVIAYMDSLLTNNHPASFNLGEARIFEQEIIAPGLSTLIENFSPASIL